jgi:aminoglycoside phosphotransferase (APT) family kinase protein
VPAEPNSTPWRRNIEDLSRGLSKWSEQRFPGSSLGDCVMPDNGMANDTLLFAIDNERYVARLAPHSASPFPTFPTFDLDLQATCLHLVRERTTVPVPEVVHNEDNAEWLGAPFLVMRHIDGEVPRDTPPYVAQGWMTLLSANNRAVLEESTVEVLAGIHTVRDPSDLRKVSEHASRDAPLHCQVESQRAYYEWARDGRRAPAIEEAFAVLERVMPASVRTVLNWGDSRIGNIIYRDCRPVGILDWEMVTVGPPEVDVAWMVFMHLFMQDMVTAYGLPGMPELFKQERVVELYERLSGEVLDDLSWYIAFAGLRFAIILLRMGLRSIAFGQRPPVDDADAIFLFAPLLRKLISVIK